jgi:shikimate dehydrogenase
MGRERYSLGLIGWPLEHSLSPAIHTAALGALGLKGSYRLYPIPPAEGAKQALASLVAQLRRGALQGLNVTIPFKQTILASLDHLTPTARAIGAVNTLYREEGRVVGDNTDAAGFCADLAAQFSLQPARVLILGAGGGARAVAYALAESSWHVVVAARRPRQAQELVSDLAPAVKGPIEATEFTPRALARVAPACALIVNATPLGVGPLARVCPWPQQVPFPPQAAAYDLAYGPGESALVRAARNAGAPTAQGLGMLVEQAALALERWTGCPAPREAMHAAVRAAHQTLEQDGSRP